MGTKRRCLRRPVITNCSPSPTRVIWPIMTRNFSSKSPLSLSLQRLLFNRVSPVSVVILRIECEVLMSFYAFQHSSSISRASVRWPWHCLYLPSSHASSSPYSRTFTWQTGPTVACQTFYHLSAPALATFILKTLSGACASAWTRFLAI